MPLSKIKPEHAKKYVGFGTKTGNLGDRDDIDDLAIIAHESQDPSLLDLFESAPSLDDLKKAKTEGQLKPKTGAAIGAISKPAAPTPQPVVEKPKE